MIDEKGQILRLQKGAMRRTRHFLIVNDKYRCQNLAHLLPNPYFCSHHITKEPNNFRNSPSSPRTTPRQGSEIAAQYAAKTTSTPRKQSFRPPISPSSRIAISFSDFEHEHSPTLPQSTAILHRRIQANDLGQNALDHHRRETLRHVRRAPSLLLPSRTPRHAHAKAKPRRHRTHATVKNKHYFISLTL